METWLAAEQTPMLSQLWQNIQHNVSNATMGDWVFFVFAVSAMVGAIGVYLARNVIYSAFSLLLTLSSVAVLYVFLGADFLATVQVMVYVGGVLVLILFGILLTGRPVAGGDKENGPVHQALAWLAGGLLLAMLIPLVRNTNWRLYGFADNDPAQMLLVPPAGARTGTTRGIAELLMTDYLLPFEIISVLLVAVLVGAVVISRSSKEV